MDIKDIEGINAATLAALRAGADGADTGEYRHFGYYTADIFECPPFTMFTNNDCPRAADILYARSFEPTSMRIWCRLARAATGILDIGAHVGVYSLAAAGLRPDLTIHAFEPNPHAYSRLRMHKTLNAYENIVEHWFAVGDEDKIVDFSWVTKPNTIASGGSINEHTGRAVEKITVPMQKLDGTGLAAALGTQPLVKVDVEGGERAAFKGLCEILALNTDLLLETFSKKACTEINAMIVPLGYNVYRIGEKSGRLTHTDKLYPCDMRTGDFNQLVTRRSPGGVTGFVRPTDEAPK